MNNGNATSSDRKNLLVIGGGVAGLTAATEAAEAGCSVVLIEKAAFLGGRAIGFNLYFPKLCPPACGFEINFRRIRNNPRITVLAQAELEELTGSTGDYEATVKISPRFVTEACTLCGDCAEACPAERADEFNFGLSKTKAAYLPHKMAFPAEYVIDRNACPKDCTACADACRYGAIDLDQQVERKKFHVAAVVLATGWAPYDASKMTNLGFGRFPNVVTNVLLERMAAANGPTRGKILRPSDGKEPASVAFVQCAGSRDENHLPYCSSVCCSASLKHSTYIHDLYPEAQVTIFYIDTRTPGLLQDFYAKVATNCHLKMIKGKVGRVEEDPQTHNLLVTAEEVLTGKKMTEKFGLVVLATGMVPQTQGLPLSLARDEFGFVTNGTPGIYATGCAKRPEEVSATVRDATGAALKALQCAVRSAHHG
ncbi:MAG TPA: CoB--CoM heterodisulfide reductase iron-sulfur subunit A family protein [Terriglobia bacterium]|nr:CoB--CoM heterodisulfide reductase iron-sulfur subunit A family protein [Terriglobia bacterium]